MNTHCTGPEIGIGEYRKRVPISELKVLIAEGERQMKRRGLEGEDMHRGAHIYARTMLHFYEQSGWQPLNKSLEDEFVERVIAELALSNHSHRAGTALSTSEFNFGIAVYDPNLGKLFPFTPATYPDPDPHPHPKTPEEQVEPLPDPILDQHEMDCCVGNASAIKP